LALNLFLPFAGDVNEFSLLCSEVGPCLPGLGFDLGYIFRLDLGQILLGAPANPLAEVVVNESGCSTSEIHRLIDQVAVKEYKQEVSQFHRDERSQILPAYAQDGILLTRIFRSSTDAAMFEDFIEELLCHCGRWPEPKSVLVMDNASFHHSQKIWQLGADAGVKLVSVGELFC
jgi:hypothetical protein